MKIKFEDHKARLIINPDYTDLDELNISFIDDVNGQEISSVNLLYLAQAQSSQYDIFCTHILYEKDGEMWVFTSGVDPDTGKFEIFNFKQSKEDYFAILDEFDNDYEDGFFNVVHKEQQYHDLKEDLSNKDNSVVKKIKI